MRTGMCVLFVFFTGSIAYANCNGTSSYTYPINSNLNLARQGAGKLNRGSEIKAIFNRYKKPSGLDDGYQWNLYKENDRLNSLNSYWKADQGLDYFFQKRFNCDKTAFLEALKASVKVTQTETQFTYGKKDNKQITLPNYMVKADWQLFDTIAQDYRKKNGLPEMPSSELEEFKAAINRIESLSELSSNCNKTPGFGETKDILVALCQKQNAVREARALQIFEQTLPELAKRSSTTNTRSSSDGTKARSSSSSTR